MKVSGIYKISNKLNSKIYIGSSNNILRRWANHLNRLRKNKHGNPLLQKSFNKWGEVAFTLSILKITNKLAKWEQFYLDKYKPYNHNIGYNICKVAYLPSGTKGKRMSKETKLKLSLYFKGKPIREEVRLKIKANWVPASNPELKGKRISKAKLKNRKNKGNKYIVINPLGKIITIKNLTVFCEENNLFTGGFMKLFRGIRKQYRGYKNIY